MEYRASYKGSRPACRGGKLPRGTTRQGRHRGKEQNAHLRGGGGGGGGGDGKVHARDGQALLAVQIFYPFIQEDHSLEDRSRGISKRVTEARPEVKDYLIKEEEGAVCLPAGEKPRGRPHN